MLSQKITLLILTILLAILLPAQQTVTKGQQKVQQTVISFFEALSNRDSVELKKYCKADIALFENGSVWTIDTLILKAITLNTVPGFKRMNSFDFIHTAVNKKTAWVTYNLKSEITRAGKLSTVQWMETVIVVKERKQWKLKVLHSTLIKRS